MISSQNLGEEPGSKDEAARIDEKTSAPTGQGEGVMSAKSGTSNAEPTAESSAQGGEPQAAESVPTDSDVAAETDALNVNAPGEELDMSASEEELGGLDLMKALVKIAELEDQLACVHADLYNLNQEYSNYVCCSKEAAFGHRESGRSEVLEALIDVPDDVDAARAHDDLDDGPFAPIMSKLEPVLGQRFLLECPGQEDEDFDSVFHEALFANMNPEVDRPITAKVFQPGYRRVERVLRAAKVMVDNPEWSLQ